MREAPKSIVPFLGNAVAVVALTMFLTLMILWTLSFHGNNAFELHGPGDVSLAFSSKDGRFMLGVFEADNNTRRWWWRPRHASIADLLMGDSDIDFIGDLWGWGFALPYWLLAGFTVIPMAWWFFVFRERLERQRRVSHGLCMECGYDLRHAQGRCPECGTPCGIQSRGVLDAPTLAHQ
jgi:hypothetical protein